MNDETAGKSGAPYADGMSLEEIVELFLGNPVPAAVAGPDGRLFLVNAAMAALTGYSRDDLPTFGGWMGRLFPDAVPPLLDPDGQRLPRGYAMPPAEACMVCRNGDRRTVTVDVSRSGRWTMVQLVDVTARRQAEDDLKTSRGNFHDIVERCAEGMLVMDADGSVRFTNRALQRLLPQGIDELVRTAVWMGDDDEASAEIEIALPDGRMGSGEVRSTQTEWGGAKARLVIVHDITDRKQTRQALQETNERLAQALSDLKRMQNRVVHDERLRAMGQMAGGIAHDFNNALMPVLGYSEILLDDPGLLEDVRQTREMLESIHEAATQAASSVRRLRDFYRAADSGELQEVDLNAIVESAVALTRPKWREQMAAQGANVEVIADLGRVPPLRASEGQLREAVTNLILNAVEALPQGGEIVIRTAQDGPHTVLSVSDNGEGMTGEARRRCFEPFFTTKGARGLGLGLPMVHGAVQRLQGEVDIVSGVGTGTTVTLTFAGADESAEHRPPPAGAETASPAPARILVIDDERSSRNVLAYLLEADRHTVEFAETGQAGIRMFRDGRFDLVITDRAMRDQSGDQVAREIRAMNGRVPVMMLTGFGDIMEAESETPEGVSVVVGKPITRHKLRSALASVLPGGTCLGT